MTTPHWGELLGGHLDYYLEELSSLVMVVLTADFRISQCNQGFLRLMNLTEKPLGQSLAGFMAPDSLPLLPLPAVGQIKPVRLPFQPRQAGVHLLVCQLLNTGHHYILIGERLMLPESSLVTKISQLNQEIVNVTRELRQKNRELQEALGHVKRLQGLLPICSACKKIRNDRGYWQQIESYIREHSDAEFTHSICPECMEKLYGDLLAEQDGS